MTPEEKDLLGKTFALSQENNVLLKKMQKSARINRVFQYLYWAFIVFGSVGAVYLGQLYVSSIQAATSIGDTPSSLTTAATSSSGIMNDINSLKQELQAISP